MNLTDELVANEMEVNGLVGLGETLDEYLEKYLGITDHELFAKYSRNAVALQILYEIESNSHSSYIDSMSEAFMIGFIYGFNYRERNK